MLISPRIGRFVPPTLAANSIPSLSSCCSSTLSSKKHTPNTIPVPRFLNRHSIIIILLPFYRQSSPSSGPTCMHIFPHLRRYYDTRRRCRRRRGCTWDCRGGSCGRSHALRSTRSRPLRRRRRPRRRPRPLRLIPRFIFYDQHSPQSRQL
jgi:hypothetical protein